MNYRLKINYILSFFPWPRLSNRQSHVDLWSLPSALIICTHSGNMQKNLSLFHYCKVNRRRRLAGWLRRILLIIPSPALHLSPSTTKAGKKRRLSLTQGCSEASPDWLSTWLQAQVDSLPSCHFPWCWMRALINEFIFTPAGMIQRDPSP